MAVRSGLRQHHPLTGTEWGDLTTGNPGFYPSTGTYDVPDLYVYGGGGGGGGYTLPGGQTLDDPGLIMSWGETTNQPLTAAWEYTYDLDPNLTGATLMCALAPPQFGGMGQVNSAGLGLVDGAGLVRSWTWNCGPAVGVNTLAWNQLWNLVIGPISGPPGAPVNPDPAFAFSGANAVPPIYFSSALFNPANVVSIIAIENGQAVNNMPAPPNLGGPFPVIWNFWGRFGVVPEPASAGLLAGAVAALFLRRRR